MSQVVRLYNTASKRVEEVTGINSEQPTQVGAYACGPTVYDFAHLGHLRKYVMDDVLWRVLRHSGYYLTVVENITDVGHLSDDGDTGEDKLEKGAKKYGKSVWEVAKEFEDFFWQSMDKIGNLRPDHAPRATEHIKAQLKMVTTLEQLGFTYIIEGDGVYFDTSKFEEYGQLAGQDLADLQAGARVEMLAGKRNSTDFAVWKFERPGENRAMVWPSPWAERSFPGWHIECSAMSMEYLGEQFAIHTGGIDHIPVHHTNEIAQAEAATGKKPFVKIWVHHNFLRVDGQKMSKSLGNFFTIKDVEVKDISPMALRLLFLGSFYRDELNFTWQSLEAAQQAYNRLQKIVADKLDLKIAQQLAQKPQSITQLSDQQQAELSPEAVQLRQAYLSVLRNDLQTPKAVAVLWQIAKGDLPSKQLGLLLTELCSILGLSIEPTQSQMVIDELPPEVQELLAQRQQARASKDFGAADRLRQKLADLGYQVTDTPQGQELSKQAHTT